MDPVTAIGLAASVVQLVQFSINVVKTCQVIYDQGSTSDNALTETTTGHLLGRITSLQKSLHDTGTQSTVLSGEEKEIIDLARNCEDCAKRLQKELGKLRVQPRQSVLKAAHKTARSIWKRGDIIKIQEQLESYRSILEMSLLQRLSQRFDAQSLSTNESFAKLDQSLRHMITCLAHSQTSFEMLLMQESAQTRHHIDAQFARLEHLRMDAQFHDDVLKSLFYPEISSRQEHVAIEFHGIEDSYDWIFNEASTTANGDSEKSQQQSQWASFSEWLKTGSEVYWINGKAGSGKSTLMSYICEHGRKDELLKEWSAERRLLTPTFFFWNAGVRQQKTVDGLLRSLIYQILKECPEMIFCFKNEPLHSWTEKRLLNALFTLFTQTQVPVAICTFIDGLDEFDGPFDAVIEKINGISNQNYVKVCLSSRPLLVFEKAFSKMPSLRLQDLTYDCIRAYAKDQLSILIEERVCHAKHDKDRIRYLLDEIVSRSEGLFLWVVTAIRDVREGLQDAADLNELESMIRDLPTGIENLYMQMLNKIKPAYRQEAIRFLQIVQFDSEQDSGDLELQRFFFIDMQRSSEDLPLICNPIEMNAVIEACHHLRKRILTHTLGLLDLVPLKLADSEFKYCYGQKFFEKDYDQILFTGLRVHHRTVLEFLIHNDAAKSFIAHVGSKEKHIRLCIARGTLTYLDHLSQQNVGTFADLYENLRTAIHQIELVERLVSAAQSKLMRSLLDCTFLRKSFDPPDDDNLRSKDVPPSAICDRDSGLCDPVAMATYCGMVRYICEILEFSVGENKNSFANLLDFQQTYSTDRPFFRALSWIGPIELDLQDSHYRRWLSEYLKWETDIQDVGQTPLNAGDGTLAETYLLSHIIMSSSDTNLAEKLTLVQTLLQAGADPMVNLFVADVRPDSDERSMSHRFWRTWLRFLLSLKRESLIDGHDIYAAGGGSIISFLLEKGLTVDELFNTTKALLAQGANINAQITDFSTNRPLFPLRRFDLEDNELNLCIRCSAMFWLEQCFHGYPEWRAFAAATKAPPISPWRELVSVFQNSEDADLDPENELSAYPDEEESNMLWPLIEKWEETGRSDDLDQLRAAMRRVFEVHRPDINLDKDEDEEEDEEGHKKVNQEINEEVGREVGEERHEEIAKE